MIELFINIFRRNLKSYSSEDLATINDGNSKAIHTDIKRHHQQHGILIPTRGNKKDIALGISYREKAVQLYLQGKDAVAITRDLQHPLMAVEGYLQTFNLDYS